MDVDETSVDIKFFNNSNSRKQEVDLLRPAGVEKGKPKFNFKVYLFGGISRHGKIFLPELS
jgi:hypothetical protein